MAFFAALFKKIRGQMSSKLEEICLLHKTTVFDLISGLFAYVILSKKSPNVRTPLNFFVLVSTVSVHYAICFIFYVLCVYPGCKTVLPKIVACEGRKEGNLYFSKYTCIMKMIYTIQ